MIEKKENMLELAKRLCIEARDLRVNEMRSIENHFWNKKSGDYRKETIKHCVRNNLFFTSSMNTGYDAMKDFIKIACPKCGREMEKGMGSGNGDSQTMQYKCEHDGTVFHLSVLAEGGISFQTKEK